MMIVFEAPQCLKRVALDSFGIPGGKMSRKTSGCHGTQGSSVDPARRTKMFGAPQCLKRGISFLRKKTHWFTLKPLYSSSLGVVQATPTLVSTLHFTGIKHYLTVCRVRKNCFLVRRWCSPYIVLQKASGMFHNFPG